MSLEDYLALREEENKQPKIKVEVPHIKDIIFEYGPGYELKVL